MKTRLDVDDLFPSSFLQAPEGRHCLGTNVSNNGIAIHIYGKWHKDCPDILELRRIANFVNDGLANELA